MKYRILNTRIILSCKFFFLYKKIVYKKKFPEAAVTPKQISMRLSWESLEIINAIIKKLTADEINK